MGNDKEKWCIGIDLGTSNTYIVAYDSDKGKIYTNESGDFFSPKLGLKDMNSNIPTRITVDPSQGGLLIGEKTKDDPSWRVFSGLKTVAREITPPNGHFGALEKPYEYPFDHCELKSKLEFGHRDFPVRKTVKDLLCKFFKGVLHIDDDKCGFDINSETIKKIVIGCPASDKPINGEHGASGADSEVHYKTTLKNILAECFGKKDDEEFKKKIVVKEEPVLAGETYLFSEGQSEKNVLVIDIGGGTTDFAIVQYNKNGTPDVKKRGSCEIAGNAIDELIFELLPDKFQVSKDVCRQAKETLFAAGKNENGGALGELPDEKGNLMIYESVPNGRGENYISLRTGELYIGGEQKKKSKRNNDDYNLKTLYQKIGVTLKGILTSWKNDGENIDTVFFVGGTSRIDSLRNYLINKVVKSEKLFPSFPNDKNHVETLFGDSMRTLSIPGEYDELKITPYNAVAIGACIEAMIESIGVECAVKPQVSFTWRDGPNLQTTDISRKKVFLRTPQFVTITHKVVEPWDMEFFLNGEVRLSNQIECEINAQSNKLEIDVNDLKEKIAKGTEGLVLIVSVKYDKQSLTGVRLEIYRCSRPGDNDITPYIEANGLRGLFANHSPIKYLSKEKQI